MIKPSNVVITAKGGDVKGTVVAEPIEKGYGLTIGNSLRKYYYLHFKVLQ